MTQSEKRENRGNDIRNCQAFSHAVNITTIYRYFGVDIDPSVTFNDYFVTSYKKATGSLHLLNKLRFQLDTKAAVTIYKSLIIPVLTYCSVLSMFDNKSSTDRLKSINSRDTRIAKKHADQAHAVTLPSIASIKKKHACMFVRKCIDGKLCENFAEYFSLQSHEKRTRNNSIILNLSSVRTEFSKKSVYFSHAKLYNELTVQILRLDSFEKFRKSVDIFFD